MLKYFNSKNGLLNLPHEIISHGIFLAMCFVLGGAQGQFDWKFLLFIISSLPQLWFVVGRIGIIASVRAGCIAVVAMAIVLAGSILQLAPIGLAQFIGDATGQSHVYNFFSIPMNSMPISYSPLDTLYSLLVILPMFCFAINVSLLNSHGVRLIMSVLFVLIIISIFVGIIQYASAGNILQFYQVSHKNSLVGFFSNKNHMGLVLACFVPLAYVLAKAKSRNNTISGLFFLAFPIILVISVATNSRAGFSLVALAMLLTMLKHYGVPSRRTVIISILCTAGIFSIVFNIPIFHDMLDRISSSGSDIRFSYLDDGLSILSENWVGGVGLGAFYSAYIGHESIADLSPLYLNNLHNDWIQIPIELGVIGFSVEFAVICFVVYGVKQIKLMPVAGQQGNRENANLVGWLGIIIIILFALHSIFDYPIRRVASGVILALAAGLVIRFFLDRNSRSSKKFKSHIRLQDQ